MGSPTIGGSPTPPLPIQQIPARPPAEPVVQPVVQPEHTQPVEGAEHTETTTETGHTETGHPPEGGHETRGTDAHPHWQPLLQLGTNARATSHDLELGFGIQRLGAELHFGPRLEGHDGHEGHQRGHLELFGSLSAREGVFHGHGLSTFAGGGAHASWMLNSHFLTEGGFHFEVPLGDSHGHGAHLGGELGAGYRTELGSTRFTLTGGGGVEGSTGSHGHVSPYAYGTAEVLFNSGGAVQPFIQGRGQVDIEGAGQGGLNLGVRFTIP